MNFSEWIRGNELLMISTPVIQSEDFDLLMLITEAIERNAAGVLLLTGEAYIKSIR